MTCVNSALPLELKYENVTVSQDSKVVVRGIALEVGTPKQIMAMGVNTYWAFTGVTAATDCVSANNDSCIGAMHGVFNASLSQTYHPTTKEGWNGTWNTYDNYPDSFTYFNDILACGNNISFANFPFIEHENTDQGCK